MLRYFLRRLILSLVALFAASALIFVALNALPGDPARVMLGVAASPEQIAALRSQWGLDAPLVTRFFSWLGGVLTGDWGQSYAYRADIGTLIQERMAVTAPLAVLAMALTVMTAMAAGIAATLHQGRARDHLIMTASQAGLAIPGFWLGLLLIILFAVWLDLLPAGGFPGWDAGGAALRALLLPALALAAFQTAILTRLVRASLIEVVHDDYMRTARAKGLGAAAALWRHGLRNAMLPLIAVIGLQAGNLLTGAIVIEQVFNLPGLGRLLFQAISNRDLPLVQSVVWVMTAVIIALNFATDLFYRWLDPRPQRLEVEGHG